MEALANERTHITTSQEPLEAPKDGCAGKAGVVISGQISQFSRQKPKVLRDVYFTVKFENVPYKEEHSQKDFVHMFISVKQYLKRVMQNMKQISEKETLHLDIEAVDAIWKTYVATSKANKP